MTKLALLAFSFPLVCAVAYPANAGGLKVEDILVQLFYENSGTLSEDVTKMKTVRLWNTIIGEGHAREPANSFLVSVVLSGKAGSFDHTEKLVVVFRRGVPTPIGAASI